MERLTCKAVSTKMAKTMQKRLGAPRWTQKLCRPLERWLKYDEGHGHTMEDAAQQVWEVILDCGKASEDEIKSKMKDKKKK